MVVPAGFFNSPTASFVDMGGKGDCGFLSIATAIVSKALLENPNSPQLKHLMQAHFRNFPHHKISVPEPTPLECLEYILKAYPRDALRALAMTIRQMAVDEMVEKPEHYRGAFTGQEMEKLPISPKVMRLETTWIDESAIKAAAVATGYPIKVKVIEDNKVLFKPLTYGTDYSEGPTARIKIKPITISLENKHYKPKVHNPALFSTLKPSYKHPIESKPAKKEDDPSMPEILAKIAAEDKRILAKFEEVKGRLMSAVMAKEINKKHLLDVYISALSDSDYLQGYLGYAGTEYGTQQFFRDLKKDQPDRSASYQLLCHDDQLLKDVAHALARAVSIQHVDEAKLWDKIEQEQLQQFEKEQEVSPPLQMR